ncbi:MAG TPA: cyclic nucleotide-binding domain-containing protein [Oscillatoriales cyanobacterium M59_W2019_021]|nr:cyclic nucleotide-binding domain-containing protein [Oscillatoriales cyanobacterium M4454_W2019_049]HIK50894.1 cyclic nucleotide-binding domain-containing protein [Oscillatoriales cyanobacterium M59_W2019_021]
MDLASHKFISFFKPEQAADLCRMAIVETLSEGVIIFDEGETSDFLYLILDGQVEFRKRIGYKQYQTLTKGFPNGFFGEMGILDGQPRSAQAIVSEKAILAKISRQSLMAVLDSIQGSEAVKIFSYMTQRLRESTEDYVKQVLHREKMVLFGEMVNTIIHDFQSPLSSIHLASSMIAEQHPDEDTIDMCESITEQAQRMSNMATEFLEFARGNPALRRSPVYLSSVLQNFERLNRIYFNQKSVEFIFKCDETILINADETKLLRVFQNLVGNAVDAFRERGGRVAITAIPSENEVKITVCDNGPGIPDGIRDRLFEPFVTYGKGGGTGLGTAIAKSIVEAHQGTISFTSTPLAGTTFYISLPLYREGDEEDEDLSCEL